MIEFTARDFDDLCRTGAVHARISTLEVRRRHAVRHFWLYLAGSLLLTAVLLVSLVRSGWPVMAVILSVLVLIIGLVLAFRPMSAAKADLKHPVLEALAARGAMKYLPEGFDPPVFPDAGRLLFGGVSSYAFTDLFYGDDPLGQRFALYEGTLSRRQGKNTVTVFTGQFYAFQRRTRGSGETVIVPDRGIFNFLKPGGLSRVRFDGDRKFEKKFEVYTTDPSAALVRLGSDVRRELVALRRAGRVYAYIGPEDVLVGVWGKNRFEPGSMFSGRSGEERVKRMFDDVCASMDVIRTLKRALD